MKKFALSVVVACAFCVTAVVAQTSPNGAAGHGTTQSSPSMGSSSRGGQTGMGQDQTGSTGQTGQMDQSGNTASHEKGEKKLKGCVQSQGGQYVLETKKGKAVALAGQVVSAHVGHEVEVKGTWESGSTASATSSGAAASSGKTFNVADVKMISDTCGGKGSKEKSGSNMGTGANGTNPSGTGAGTTGTGGTGSQPPQ
jgi:hypothetical protein